MARNFKKLLKWPEIFAFSHLTETTILIYEFIEIHKLISIKTSNLKYLNQKYINLY